MQDFVPLKIIGQCVETDETLFSNMDAAIARGLPQVTKPESPKPGVIAIVASGPSVREQLETIRQMKQSGTPIMAVKDAHDWLIENGVIPDYALAVDPQAHRWNCFTRARSDVKYMIASQCHAAMFDYLAGLDVTLWHLQMKQGQDRPKNSLLIGGGTTSGLRAISLSYVLGWRNFALFGFDSSLKGDDLRVNGTGLKPGDSVVEVRIDPVNGPTYFTNASMALQAEHFQAYFDFLPDAQFIPFGDGLIPALIRAREQQAERLATAHAQPADDRVSFIHRGDRTVASYRYRAQLPSHALRQAGLTVNINDLTAGTLIFAKPQPNELMEMAVAKAQGKRVGVDFCDDHFGWMHYEEALRMADIVTCPTAEMAKRIKERGREAIVLPDGYVSAAIEPHAHGNHVLWFGHSVNRDSIERVLPQLQGCEVRVVSNFPGAIPWKLEEMPGHFAWADIVIMPATAEYKSNNRALEAAMNGCFVVAEPHPSMEGLDEVWVGDIQEGIQWATTQPETAREATKRLQQRIIKKYSPQILGAAWKNAIRSPITSDAVRSDGPAGSMSIPQETPTLQPTC